MEKVVPDKQRFFTACHFCMRQESDKEIKLLIQGVFAAICSECVAACVAIMNETGTFNGKDTSK